MEEKKIVKYTEDTELTEGTKYIVECGIEFIYQPCTEKPNKPYLLNNGYRLDHIPTTTDKRTNNLISMSSRTMEDRQKIGSKGGVESQKVQGKRRTFQQSMELILNTKASIEEINELPLEVQEHIKNNGIIPTKEDIISYKAVALAIAGSDKHMVFSRDTVGDKPTDKTQVEANVITDGDRLLLDKLSRRLQEDM